MLLPHAWESTPSTTALHKSCVVLGVDDNLSQICNAHPHPTPWKIGRHASRHRLKTHSQCQRCRQILRLPPKRQIRVFIPGYLSRQP